MNQIFEYNGASSKNVLSEKRKDNVIVYFHSVSRSNINKNLFDFNAITKIVNKIE